MRRWTRLTITCLGNARCGTSKATALSIGVTRVIHQGFAWCPTVQMPFVRDRKWKKKWVCLRYSRGFAEHCSAPALRYPLASGYAPCKGSEFRPLPIFCFAQTGTPKGQRRRGRLSLLTFFGEAKKVSSRPATPGNALLHEERTASISTANQTHNKKPG